MKRWFQSKTIWVNVLAAICLAVQAKWGFVIDAQAQAAILIVANLILRGMTKEAVTLAVLLVCLGGCGSWLRGPEAQYEGSFECSGKVALTGNGSISIGAGYGGSGTNAWTLQGDCGDGFKIQRYRERQAIPALPPPPVEPQVNP